ncbi:MAG: hypothetical protein K2H40_10765, partial [Lachnospiraceae bacterium]|nr:hypothetical protein [Lachnospiraceae bacterium]
INSVIVNGNEGGVQTTDISVETGKDIWLVVTGAETYEVFYEKPADAVTDAAADETETLAAQEDTEQGADAAASVPAEPSETEDAGVNTGIVVLIVVICVMLIAFVGYSIVKKKKS